MSKKVIQKLKNFKVITAQKYRSYFDQVADLYEKKQIRNIKTAKNILIQLSGRGTAPKVAIDKINKYDHTPSIKGRLSDEVADYYITYLIPITIRERTK